MTSLNIFWLHLIKAKEQKITEHIDYQNLHYSILHGFTKKPSKNDLFKITFQKSGDYTNILDLYNNILFAEFDEIPNELVSYIRLYVPLLMASRLKPSRPLIITHFAQSLDGKICTSSGKSKWISNNDNLNHSHRLRAMVDGVMVGGGTIKADKPKLTVRRVEGNNPKRIFWCNSINDYTSYKAHNTYTVLIADKDIIKIKPKGIDHYIAYSNENQPINEVLAKLKEFGVNSIFIEGGSITLSNFFEARLIDLMQIHIAPIIFGSGKCAFEGSPIDEVSESLKLEGFFSTSDNHILYHGKPIYKE
jgi:diaminohydroxyphosphoribosylaminopyrimidine deaminase / 5-amino-6-(5-phosphoribosylamino)uracil reductase